MKNIYKLIAAAAASMLAFSCTPHFPEANQSLIPQASALTPVITVDNETNYVTFGIEQTGVVPMWIFPADQKIDGKNNKNYAYVGNGISLRIREEGIHTVELKAYNQHGISLGSQVVTFSLENTYRDPFDPSKYYKNIANTWVWNADAAGHFGCGEPGSDGTNWWSAGPQEKADWSLYDDLMTFTADGTYIYDPVDGQVYVNKESGYKNEYNTNDGNDYLAPIERFESTFTIQNEWNAAGVEDIYVVLNAGENLSYIPNPEALTNPRYRILSLKAGKELKLVNDNGAIAWHYGLIPYVKEATPMDKLAGTDEKGKAWIMDSEAAGHLGCGPDGSAPASWWSAGPNEKAAFGLYDDILTFYPDGKYVFNPGPDGLIYVNKDVTDLLGSPASEDVDIPWEEQVATFDFDGDVIKLPAGVVIGYVPNNAYLADATFYVTELTETNLTGYVVTDGIAWQYKFKARDIKAPESSINGVAFAGGKADLSFTQGEAVNVTGIELGYIDPDFFEGEAGALTFAAQSGDYRVYNQNGFLKVVPMEGGEPATYDNGGALWIIGTGIKKPADGNEPGWNTDPSVDLPFAKTGANTYKMTAYVTGPNFKIFGQANWGMEIGGDNYTVVEANNYFTINGFPGGAASDNGNIWSGDAFEEGWYVLQIKDNGDGSFEFYADKKKETYFDIEGETNLWRKATITPEYWYSPASWAGGIEAQAEIGTNNDFTAFIPAEVGGSEWMAQNKLHTGIATSSEKIYDFCCTLLAEEDCVVTIKLTGNPEGDGDPHAFFYDGNVKITGGEPLVYKRASISQPQSNGDFTVIFDFGRVPVNTTISATRICFQEHIER